MPDHPAYLAGDPAEYIPMTAPERHSDMLAVLDGRVRAFVTADMAGATNPEVWLTPPLHFVAS
jgi:hypothetical protein